MGTKLTRGHTWTETDRQGRVTVVTEEKTCGPVCKTVKVAGTVAVIALVLSAITGKR